LDRRRRRGGASGMNDAPRDRGLAARLGL
jgi:hypothetical protein